MKLSIGKISLVSAIAATFMPALASAWSPTDNPVNSSAELRSALDDVTGGQTIIIAPGTYTYTGSTYSSYTRDGHTNVAAMYELKNVSNVTIKAQDPNNKPVLQGKDRNDNYVFYGQSVTGLTIEDVIFTNSKKGVVIDASDNVTLDSIVVHNIGWEGVHFRDDSDHATLLNSLVYDIGMERWDRGEGLYICNDRKMWNSYYQPTPVQEDLEQNCDFAKAYNNTFGPNIGAEHIDVKEGTQDIEIYNNTFIAAIDSSAGGVALQNQYNNDEIGVDGFPKSAPKFLIHMKGKDALVRNNLFKMANAFDSVLQATSVSLQLDDDPTMWYVYGFNNTVKNNRFENLGTVRPFAASSDGGATFGCNWKLSGGNWSIDNIQAADAPNNKQESMAGTGPYYSRNYTELANGSCGTLPSAGASGSAPPPTGGGGSTSSSSGSTSSSGGGFGGTFDLPTKIEAEKYTAAPVESTTGNSGGSPSGCTYYGLDVDVQNSSDDSTCNIGWTTAGEKLEYKVDQGGGTYNINLRAASNSAGNQIRVRVNGAVVGTQTITNGGWSGYNNHTISGVTIHSDATIQVEFVHGGVNLNYINVTSSSGGSSSSSTSSTSSSGSSVTLNAVDYTYSTGIQLVDNGTAVGYFDAGDQLQYDNTNFDGLQSVTITYSGNWAGREIEIRRNWLNGPLLATVTLPSTGSWSTYSPTITVPVSSSTGSNKLVIKGKTGNSIANFKTFKLNY